jgi:hypothetical protein
MFFSLSPHARDRGGEDAAGRKLAVTYARSWQEATGAVFILAKLVDR